MENLIGNSSNLSGSGAEFRHLITAHFWAALEGKKLEILFKFISSEFFWQWRRGCMRRHVFLNMLIFAAWCFGEHVCGYAAGVYKRVCQKELKLYCCNSSPVVPLFWMINKQMISRFALGIVIWETFVWKSKGSQPRSHGCHICIIVVAHIRVSLQIQSLWRSPPTTQREFERILFSSQQEHWQ